MRCTCTSRLPRIELNEYLGIFFLKVASKSLLVLVRRNAEPLPLWQICLGTGRIYPSGSWCSHSTHAWAWVMNPDTVYEAPYEATERWLLLPQNILALWPSATFQRVATCASPFLPWLLWERSSTNQGLWMLLPQKSVINAEESNQKNCKL